MFRHIMKIATPVALSFFLNTVAYCQNRWDFREIYSTADGSVQFIVLLFNGYTADLPALAGQTLIAGDGNPEHSFTFANNVTHYFSDYGFDTGPCDTLFLDGCWSYVLVATQKFADLNLVKPDFVVPNGFLFVSHGSVLLGASESHYESLPTDGQNARWWNTGVVFEAEAINNAGESYRFTMPVGVNPLVEYYNAGLDDYFLTAYPSEIQYLDSGQHSTLGLPSNLKLLFLPRRRTPILGPVRQTSRVYIGCGIRVVRTIDTRSKLSFATRC